jgi:transposase
MISYETWCQIRDCRDRQHMSLNQIAKALHLHHSTVATWADLLHYEPRKKVARTSVLDPFKGQVTKLLDTNPFTAQQVFQRLRESGYGGGYTTVKNYVRSICPCPRRAFDSFEWMRTLLQKMNNDENSNHQLDGLLEEQFLLNRLYTGRLSERNKALSILAYRFGIPVDTICSFLGISTVTYSRYKKRFINEGGSALFARRVCTTLKSDDETLKNAIFKVLHEPPSNYGINRTTWTMALIRKVLTDNGKGACPEVVRKITRAAGYRWRKARIMLTSKDPSYTEKLDHIHSILAGLQSDEVFFSIDEYGPFAVKMYGGRKLVAPGEQTVIPQWQRIRGSLILTAALELSSNQITHFFSKKKNTDEMIKMMDVLVAKYSDRRKIYLSWDAASWHISKQLNERIAEHNINVAICGGAIVETVPLPAGAQFLNVIESVFSGMSQAIIHNSNYSSVEVAMVAINRYLEERNDHFQKNPQRAGKKIWGKEREPATFSDSNNCKDPRYR